MHTWYWCNWEGLPYLRCHLLDAWPHGFFTRSFAPRSPLELSAILQPTAQIYRIKQVHGNTVLATHEITHTDHAVTDLAAADGVLTHKPDQAIWVCSADCTPILIADGVTGQVSAIHAGWRGTATQILPQAIARLQSQGSQLTDLRIAMGPAISGSVYQVATEVAATVGATIVPESVNQPADPLLVWLAQLPNPPILPDPEPGRVRLDVRRVNALQLERLGIKPEQVAIAPDCTYQQPDRFFSYRRDGLKQVQWSGIVSC
ncbi:laccase [Neosynechococcus sphagnicola sy1]|uniref:Purine nucleoside phosphorylase n=1 Tax=Neosynechococcus sphagnicola sy1 TaxID=1497020 RepID=A0A098TPE3_9CYAN|nr:peptidoglycan editing factor PgeF [Neosynechococcus sphagnicola]KGF72708.1 laccase [Neosynechococcus sphagnicola sy1]